MNANAVAAAAIAAAIGCAQAVQLNEIAVNFAAKTDVAPVLDGRLDDEVWQKAPVHTRFYEYCKPHPKLAPIRSEMRLLYTDKALWIGIRHHEDAIDKLKVIGTVRDSVDWYEDMDEIYIDPYGDAIGFTKLLINTAGVIGDMRRVDGSVTLNEWSGNAWQAKTCVGDDWWSVEVCLPYSDLQRPPVPGGALWRFCVTRYQWTSGKFVGSVSSPKGAYMNPSGFGYLYFLPQGEAPRSDVIVSALKGKVAPPWCLALGDAVLYDVGDGVKTHEGEIQAFLDENEKADRDRMETFRKRLEEEFGGKR